MKNWKRNLILTLAAVLAGSVFIFAGSDNSVVSLSYLTGTFWEKLMTGLQGKTEDLEETYNDAEEALAEKLGQDEEYAGWNTTSAPVVVYPMAGETVTLSAGSGCVWLSGTGAASSILIDITTGSELAAGQSLVAGHRYLAEQETVITAFSASSCSAEGVWKSTATGKAPVELPFKDVSASDWYYSAVAYVVERGLFNGVTTTTFEPKSSMNRAMLVTVLHRVAGTPAAIGANGFADVKDSDWFGPGVLWASQIGVVTGTSQTQFNPLGSVTREQIAVILYRYAAYLGYDVSARASLAGFSDQSKVSSYALEGISWAVAEGLLQGSDGRLNPTSGASRAEVATMMQRYEAWLASH